ncbi:SGS domain-containing protein [Ditylenchus destructor]|uniref:SGS domain-containing protein n=1 Tax=Ditylenchus destructor TaxID=166010 RepID=A0AAD4N5R9_9BILA|nr:SGS domain-containing protein [Ditylenchus destructor]
MPFLTSSSVFAQLFSPSFYYLTVIKLFYCCILLSHIFWSDAHVTLTFPEARYPPLDFLDTARTTGPCGVPKSTRSLLSTLQVGENYNFSWRMQYPHQGGFRIQLFDQSGALVEQLAPKTDEGEEFAGLNDQTAETQLVQFTKPCQNCTVRLERQALEWGKAYRFRSCAEINIVEKLQEQCSGRGNQQTQTKCRCDRNFSGELCQYEDDCTDDIDCKSGGKCLRDKIQQNRKSCFCAYGYFGLNCEKKSCYKKVELNKHDVLYSRVVKNQVEIVLDFQTQSYVALGWRPLQIPSTCRLFPDLASTSDGGDKKNSANSGYLQSALNAPLHAMDCTDIVMASIVDGNFLHIEDMYTRDRSTPLSDSWLDGEQSLSAAYGVQTEDRSVVMFRRMIREIEPTDHPLGPGKIFVIYAKGQTSGSYKHLTPSAIEKSNQDGKEHIRNKDFYKDDQWKYHGSQNRGIRKLELVSAEEMSGSRSPLIHPDTLAREPVSHNTITIKASLDVDSNTTASAPLTTSDLSTLGDTNFNKDTSSTILPTAPKTEPEPNIEPVAKPEPTAKIEPTTESEHNADLAPTAEPEPAAEPEPNSVQIQESDISISIQLSTMADFCKTKYQFYQTETEVVICISTRGLPLEDYEDSRVNFTEFVRKIDGKRGQEMNIVCKDKLIFSCKLLGRVDEQKTTIQCTTAKIEVHLAKLSSVSWKTLHMPQQWVPPEKTQSELHAEALAAENEEVEGAIGKTKSKPNWDKLIQEAEEEELKNMDPNARFYKMLYDKSDENGRRAMVKSLQESGGTVLNNSWDAVKSHRVMPHTEKKDEDALEEGPMEMNIS